MNGKTKKKGNFSFQFNKDSEARFMTFIELLEKSCISFMDKKAIEKKVEN